jgi:hypothetical protein
VAIASSAVSPSSFASAPSSPMSSRASGESGAGSDKCACVSSSACSTVEATDSDTETEHT